MIDAVTIPSSSRLESLITDRYGATEVIDSSNSGRAIKAFGCTRGTQGGAATSSDDHTLQHTTDSLRDAGPEITLDSVYSDGQVTNSTFAPNYQKAHAYAKSGRTNRLAYVAVTLF